LPTAYHRIAGTSLERLAAVGDGIFAVAMTLLVLDLRRGPGSVARPVLRPAAPVR
jgi:uncharacterized membrane protein